MSSDSDQSVPYYQFKPSLLGANWEFRLAPDALEWQGGARSGRLPYRDIRRLRLSFRPVTLQSYRFLAEIWPARGPKIQIASSSWRSMFEQERHDDFYTRFIIELHRRLAEANPRARCESGVAAPMYWPGLAVFVAVALGLAALTARALQTEAWAGAALIGGFLVLFLWQAGGYFKRNRPTVYPPQSPPPDVLPRP